MNFSNLSNDSLRNGPEAVRLSKEIVLKTQGQDHHLLLTLTVALAETGQFPAAIAMAEQAAILAERGKNQQKAIWIRSEIIPLFQQQQPMRCHGEILAPF